MYVTELDQTECAAPIVFALKSNEAIRCCVNYQKLNVVSVKDSYQLQRMDKCFKKFGAA